MLHKFLHVHRLLRRSFLFHAPPKPAPSSSTPPPKAAAVKIIHVGGIVEHYYMAVPARTIMEKYPSFLLARPEIFRRPWESVVWPEEILTPGQKFYVIPRRTMRKLQRRVQRPTTREFPLYLDSKQSSINIFDGPNSRDSIDGSSIESSEFLRYRGGDGNSTSHNKATDNSTPSEDLLSTKEMDLASPNPRLRQRRARKMVMWYPTLTVISEAPSPNLLIS